MNNFDVIIVGAGTSGIIAARFATKFGLNVCLIDYNKKERIGNKVCGDGILSTIFDFLKIPHPKGEILLSTKNAVRLYSSNFENYITIDIPIYLVDRVKFGQKMLNDALDLGVSEFLDKTKALDLSYKNGNVNGVKIRQKNGQKKVLKAKIVIDGSGVNSSLRRNINSSIIQNKIPKYDLAILYREIIQYKNINSYLSQDFLTVVFDPDNIPGGYFWFFPKSDNISNLGLGLFLHEKSQLKYLYKNFVCNRFLKTNNFAKLASRGDIIPIRRPLPSCADNGIMFIGDAGCHVNTSSGGGIHTGMRAGYYAALISKKAIDNEDYSLNILWEYNCKIVRDFGMNHAINDIARILLQYSSTKDLDFIIKKKLINNKELIQMWHDETISPKFSTLISKFTKGLSRPKILFNLAYILKNMNKFKKHYTKYPNSLNGFNEWRRKEQIIFNKVFSKYSSYKMKII